MIDGIGRAKPGSFRLGIGGNSNPRLGKVNEGSFGSPGSFMAGNGNEKLGSFKLGIGGNLNPRLGKERLGNFGNPGSLMLGIGSAIIGILMTIQGSAMVTLALPYAPY